MKAQPQAEAEATAEALSKEIARCVARHQCHNTDLVVDPYELLDSACKVIAWLEDQLIEKEHVIEGHESWQDETITSLKLQANELVALKQRLAMAPPWLATLIDRLKP